MQKSSNKKSNPTIFIIFGGNGDLNKRKIIPALYNLFLDNRLPEKFAIIGTSRTKFTDEKHRKLLLDSINEFSRRGKADKESWAKFSANISYQDANIKDAASYKEFGTRIETYKKEWEEKPSVLYYCAVSPDFFCTIANNISKSNLENDSETTRIIIEKPFGRDL
jgi:glucose-6-phosphate 1-dehydrogenase